MTDETLKQANEISKEIEHIEARLNSLNNEHIKFNSLLLGSIHI